MDLIGLLVTVVVLGLVFYLLWWLLGVIALPEPFNKVAIVLLALVAVVLLLGVLFGGISVPRLRL
jgi:heme A synthase